MPQQTLYENITFALDKLRSQLEGDIFTDIGTRLLYATDASVYREVPAAVVRPKNKEDIKSLVRLAAEKKFPLIPRTAGTSLAGQVVGNGVVVDVSKYINRIIELNTSESWVRVEPGVVLDELNKFLEPHGLFFGPETSTSNRCMIAGMVANNSCGAHSLVYGSTRDHTLAVNTILSNGSEVEFGPISRQEFEQKCKGDTLEAAIYRNISKVFSDPSVRGEIRSNYPDPSLKRRNTGYAIDVLLDNELFSDSNRKFNFSNLIAGSEGTLAFITEIKLNLVPLPPPVKGLLCIHCNTLENAFKGNLVVLKHNPVAVELMDDVIIRQTSHNIEQQKNRFFIRGEPAAVLIAEFAAGSKEEIIETCTLLEAEMRTLGYGYHFPLLFGADIPKVWSLRKAGLGLLSNLAGDAKPVAVIEDTAVNPQFLPEYMDEFRQVLEKYQIECVYYAHIATGELHLRPVLDLKKEKDIELFRIIAQEIAILVKKYRGSISGEHGDGRLRGEFIPFMIGEKNYAILEEIKKTWDPDHIFNPGKITATPAMNTSLRYRPGQVTREIPTHFDFSADQGILRSIEKCNGSADCRKSSAMGGTMCPSYMATTDENTTTRARANLLREFLTHSEKANPFDHKELFDILDLCLSCKGCKSECPSSVDMAKLKAEFLQHYYETNKVPLRSWLIGNLPEINKIASLVPEVYNFFITNPLFSGWMKKSMGFAEQRSIPSMHPFTLTAWLKEYLRKNKVAGPKGAVYLFVDEFTGFNDTVAGIKTVELLTKLGYEVRYVPHKFSGRTLISKGFVKKAKALAGYNISLFHTLLSKNTPLIGVEPSAILSFRDEYPDLVRGDLKDKALEIAPYTLLVEEFLAKEADKGNISPEQFTDKPLEILVHGHCHQKSLSSVAPTIKIMSIPENYRAVEIKSGCCGMAGSFGYEKEHYELSMKVGELVLFPAIRKSPAGTVIVAPGTSCRHQIRDGTGRPSFHPAEVLFDALL